MKKIFKRLCTGFLAFATIVTALPTTAVHAESKQYWTQSNERVGIVEKVMNDGSIGSTFNEGHLTVDGEDAYCIDINTDFRNGYKTRADASTRMSADQIADVALSIEYVKQYTASHGGLSSNHAYLLRQLVVWQRLSVHLGWQCDNVRASYDEIPKATQDEVFAGAKAFVKENKGRYECGGYIYSGEGQELGQFWANLNVGNATLQKSSTNTSITDGTMFAPCGMNCLVCYKHCYHKKPCAGCLNSDKGKPEHCRKCKIKDCIKDKGLSYCFECSDYPCKLIKNLEKSYNKRYQASLMENSNTVRQHGLEIFMEKQKEKYTCSKCGGIISIHDRECSECQEKME